MHDHDWQPLAGFRAVYVCHACKATGYKGRDGSVIPHGQSVEVPATVTARGLIEGTGRVPRKAGAV